MFYLSMFLELDLDKITGVSTWPSWLHRCYSK